LEDFDFTAQPGAEERLILHLAQLSWITEHSNVCFIAPPGTGETISRSRWRSRPANPANASRSPPTAQQ
jgi:hypothetical protein